MHMHRMCLPADSHSDANSNRGSSVETGVTAVSSTANAAAIAGAFLVNKKPSVRSAARDSLAATTESWASRTTGCTSTQLRGPYLQAAWTRHLSKQSCMQLDQRCWQVAYDVKFLRTLVDVQVRTPLTDNLASKRTSDTLLAHQRPPVRRPRHRAQPAPFAWSGWQGWVARRWFKTSCAAKFEWSGACANTHWFEEFKQKFRIRSNSTSNILEDVTGAGAEGSKDRYDLVRTQRLTFRLVAATRQMCVCQHASQ